MRSQSGSGELLYNIGDVVDGLYLDTSQQLLYATLFINGSIVRFNLTVDYPEAEYLIQGLDKPRALVEASG